MNLQFYPRSSSCRNTHCVLLVLQLLDSTINYERDLGYSFFGFKVNFDNNHHHVSVSNVFCGSITERSLCGPRVLPELVVDELTSATLAIFPREAGHIHACWCVKPVSFLRCRHAAFGLQTMERSYLLKINGQVAERPQHMLMRVALGIHGEDLKAAIETYHCLSLKYFTHASPTLFNAGTPRNQLSRCALIF